MAKKKTRTVKAKEQAFPGGFEGCVRVMSRRPGVADPEALCAHIGRRAGKILGSMTEGERLGAFLRNQREESGFTLEQAADSIGKKLGTKFDPSTLGQIETGEIETPSAPVLAALARTYSVTVEQLERLIKGEPPEQTRASEQSDSPLAIHAPQIRQFDDQWCLLEPDGSKGRCFGSRDEAEDAARRIALEALKLSEQEFRVFTSADPRDGHVHEIVELDENGNGKTGEAGGEQSEPHSHEIRAWEVVPMKAADSSYTSEHPGSLPDDAAMAEAGHGQTCPPGQVWCAGEGKCVPSGTTHEHDGTRHTHESRQLLPFSGKAVTGRFAEAEPLDKEGKVWKVVLIEEGLSKNGRLYSREVLRDALDRKIFEGIPAFGFVYRTPDGLILDHAPDGVSTQDFAKDVAGFHRNVRLEETSGGKMGLTAEFHFVDDVLQRKFLEAWKAGNKGLFGFSIDALGEGEPLTKETVEIKYIVRANSDDLVSHPAAGGRFVRMVASMARKVIKEDGSMDKRKLLLQLIMEVKPSLLEGKKADDLTLEDLQRMIAGEEFAPIRQAFAELSGATAKPGAQAPKAAPAPAPASAELEVAALVNESVKKAVLEANWPGKVETAIREAKLDGVAEAAELVRDLAAKAPGDEAHLKASVGRAQKLLEASGWEDPKLGGVKPGAGVEDKWRRAIESAVQGKPGKEGTPPFKNFRHALQVMTGRVDWHPREMMRMLAAAMGRVCATWNDNRLGDAETKPLTEAYTAKLREASRSWFGSIRETINVAAFAELFGDSVTRQLIADYQLPALNDWRAVVSKISNLDDLRTQRRIRVGQYGNAATVAEGAAYLAATSPQDEEVTFTLTKRGDVETITEEAMLQDDLGELASIPRRMTRGLLQQIRKIVWGLIDPATNPVIFDGNPLFQLAGAHVNAVATTLNLGTLNDTRRLMRKQTAFNGATHELSTVPKFLIVTPELENTANQFSSSQFEPTSNLFQVANLHRGLSIIVLDHFTDTDAFVVVGDPSTIPTIEVGSIDGRIEPELFTQDDPTTGSFFDSDSIKMKRKSRFGAVVLDWRGFSAGIPGLV